MEEIKQVPNGADIALSVSTPSEIDGIPFNPKNKDAFKYWEIELWVFSNKKVKVRYTPEKEQAEESLGEIQANFEPYEDRVKLWVKSSENPFGVGTITGQMTIVLNNDEFADRLQVTKTHKINSRIQIV